MYGYLNFVQIFFYLLAGGSIPFPQGNGTYDVDLDYTLEMSMRCLHSWSEKDPTSSPEEYWNGITSAMDHSLKVLKLAYNISSMTEKAA